MCRSVRVHHTSLLPLDCNSLSARLDESTDNTYLIIQNLRPLSPVPLRGQPATSRGDKADFKHRKKCDRGGGKRRDRNELTTPVRASVAYTGHHISQCDYNKALQSIFLFFLEKMDGNYAVTWLLQDESH